MKTTAARLLPTLGRIAFPIHGFAESFLVENGEPRAEIVIFSDPPRSTRLAAWELQNYLRELDVRWYMHGKLGVAVPRRGSIALPKIDRWIEPTFPLRDCSIRVGIHDQRLAAWSMRPGMRQPREFGCTQVLTGVTARDDDPAISYGECIEVLLETEEKFYHPIAISPTGDVVDIDRAQGKKKGFRWDSQTVVMASWSGADYEKRSQEN